MTFPYEEATRKIMNDCKKPTSIPEIKHPTGDLNIINGVNTFIFEFYFVIINLYVLS